MSAIIIPIYADCCTAIFLMCKVPGKKNVQSHICGNPCRWTPISLPSLISTLSLRILSHSEQLFISQRWEHFLQDAAPTEICFTAEYFILLMTEMIWIYFTITITHLWQFTSANICDTETKKKKKVIGIGPWYALFFWFCSVDCINVHPCVLHL